MFVTARPPIAPAKKPLQQRIQQTGIWKMNITCPHCKIQLVVQSSQAGSLSTCPNCGGTFQIAIPTGFFGDKSQEKTHLVQSEVQAFANKKIAAGICGILVGGLGIHKFILGLNTAGAIMLAVWLSSFITGMCIILPLAAAFAMQIIGIIEGITYLTKTDEDFYQTYAVQKKEWF
jgi:TM2 domain-containing membrane protein YozV/ribosomal protein S27E